VIITRTNGAQREYRSFALTDMVKWGYSDLRYSNLGGATPKAVAGIPALGRAFRMRSEAIASLRFKIWSGSGLDKKQVDGAWQARLFAQDRYNDYQTRFAFWETLEESMSYRGNAYVWKNSDPQTGRVAELCALHPDQVTCKSDGYTVDVEAGYVDPVGRGPGKYKGLDDDVILHVRGHGEGGALEAPSPIRVFRDALAAPLGRMRHEERMWRKGTAIQQAVVFPPGTSYDQANEWRDGFKNRNEGMDGDTTMLLGGGAQIVPIGMTLADAQFAEMARLTVHDAAHISGVPANLLGAQTEHPVPNLEQDLAGWLRFGLGPECERIESAFAADEQLFPLGTGGSAGNIYGMFDTEGFIRGELITEANIMHLRIQDGTLTPDEARAQLGYPPHPDGKGAEPQITPVGGAANPVPSTIPKSVAED
jgi:HK97 family phage portal protein